MHVLCATYGESVHIYARTETEQSEVHLSRVERGLQRRAASSNKCNKEGRAFRESSRSDLARLSRSEASWGNVVARFISEAHRKHYIGHLSSSEARWNSDTERLNGREAFLTRILANA